MQPLKMQQPRCPKLQVANDNWPHRLPVAADRRPGTLRRRVLTIFGLLTLTVASCLLGIGAVETAMRWM